MKNLMLIIALILCAAQPSLGQFTTAYLSVSSGSRLLQFLDAEDERASRIHIQPIDVAAGWKVNLHAFDLQAVVNRMVGNNGSHQVDEQKLSVTSRIHIRPINVAIGWKISLKEVNPQLVNMLSALDESLSSMYELVRPLRGEMAISPLDVSFGWNVSLHEVKPEAAATVTTPVADGIHINSVNEPAGWQVDLYEYNMPATKVGFFPQN